MMSSLIFLTLLFLCNFKSAFGANYGHRKFVNPLLGDEDRKHFRSTECHFGKTIKELGSTWSADLGPPFGVMYCIRCECVPFQKKRRIVAKVQCRNIKHDCPKPTCDEPVLLPGRCCKICPGDQRVPDVPQDIPMPEEDKNMKYFGALLTGRTSLVFKRDDIVNIPSTSKNPMYQIVATGRFTFHKKNLFYSFYLSNALNQTPPRPKTIQFINYNGDLLEEQTLYSANSVYQNATSKVCGVWRRIPREYKRLLRDETLYVALLWGNDLALSGLIARMKALNTEQFSALLTPHYPENVEPDSGGTAIISTLASYPPYPPTIHISLVFNGVFTPDEINDVPLTVRLENSERDQVVFEEIIRVQKPSSTLNFEEVKGLISMNELRMITRGKFKISITSRSKPDLLSLSGPVVTRTACEVFQTPLAPASEVDGLETQETTLMVGPSPASGMAWMYVNRDGSLSYNIQVDEMRENPTFTLLPLGKAKKAVDTQQFVPSHIVNGVASGVLDKLSPKTFELLYSGELSINVASSKSSSTIRGRLTSRPVAGAIDSHAPILLKRLDSKKNTDLTGMAWLSIGFDCDLHYEIQLSGSGSESHSYQLYLENMPLIAPNAPVSRRLLEDFNGTFVEGFAQLTPPELSKMDSGVSFLEVTDLHTGKILLKASIKQVKIPVECLSHVSDNDVSSFISLSAHTVPEITKCYHEGMFYDEGSQWRHARDPCKMCHCLRGKEKCDDVVCPALSCPIKFKPAPGECCPTCTDPNQEGNTSVGCVQAGLFYRNGSVWHPYLLPYGFNLCIVMTCIADAKSSTIKYSRVTCPPLKCSEKEAVRMDKNSCCKQCPVPEVGYAKDQSVSVQKLPRKKTDQEILQEGGCIHLGKGPYENNTEWSHKIESVGVIPCVKCRCKDGKTICERKRCLRSQCNNSTTLTNNDTDDCCSHQCRYRRQSKHNQRRKSWDPKKRGHV
ncbi:UNVERIFIED_CONTAM: hypothetical protein PYX00_010127 [Menopon gallinae]|uniref:Short gastrulation n=1 Tax=Menopon gallinae TaxID=328185 RepID=A0AAW2HEB0_9NEOP